MDNTRDIQKKLNEIENTLRALPIVLDDTEVWQSVRNRLSERLDELDGLYTIYNTPEE